VLELTEPTLKLGADVRRVEVGWNGFYWLVDVTACPELIAGFQKILRGWDVNEVPVRKSDEPAIVFRKSGNGFDWDSSWARMSAKELYGKPDSTVAAICDFHYLFTGWFVDQFDDFLSVHCAGVQFGDGIVLFPGTHRAGKSLLTVALAAKGHKAYGDDVLAIDPQRTEAVGLGMLPRVRLPLPPQAVGEELRAFIHGHAAMRDDDHLYVNLDREVLADVGQSLPIHAIVQLKRTNKKVPVGMDPATTGTALRALISQNYNTSMPASRLFGYFEQIANRTANYSLTYHCVEDAISILEATFGKSQSDLHDGSQA